LWDSRLILQSSCASYVLALGQHASWTASCNMERVTVPSITVWEELSEHNLDTRELWYHQLWNESNYLNTILDMEELMKYQHQCQNNYLNTIWTKGKLYH
jgi:hypothetical protein